MHMRVIGTGRAVGSSPGKGQFQDADQKRASQSRAIVPVAPLSRPQTLTVHQRPDAAFLAHLIATAQGAPQTRERRRAEPAEAILLYASQQRAGHARAWFSGAM
jgi:hypothetical protein